MKSEVTITLEKFDEKVNEVLDSLMGTGINPCTPLGTAVILKGIREKVFEEEHITEDHKSKDKYHSVKSFESTHATINVLLPEGMEWEDLPEEVKTVVTESSKGFIKKGESHDIEIDRG